MLALPYPGISLLPRNTVYVDPWVTAADPAARAARAASTQPRGRKPSRAAPAAGDVAALGSAAAAAAAGSEAEAGGSGKVAVQLVRVYMVVVYDSVEHRCAPGALS